MTRLDDIARQASVSKATVSRVLNDRPGVRPALRDAVLTAVDVLGLERPERLRAQNTGIVGLVVPQLDDPLLTLAAQVVQSHLAAARYSTLLCAVPGAGEEEAIRMLQDRAVAGIIIVSGRHADAEADHSHYAALVERGLPLVLVDGHLPDLAARFVSVDDRAAGGLAVDHLLGLGHERIGLVSATATGTRERRFAAGAKAALARHGAVELLLDVAFAGHEGGYAGATRLLERGVTAIACTSDLMALGATRAARRLGRRVPDDVSVVGYGDSTLMAFTEPALTTVRQPVLAMGAVAAQSLLDGIAGRTAPAGESLFLPELVVRASTAPRR